MIKFLLILLLFVSAADQQSYDSLMNKAMAELSEILKSLQDLKNYKFDYAQLAYYTSSINDAVSLINEAKVLHEQGKDNEAIAKLNEAIAILEDSKAKIHEYLSQVKQSNNFMRILAFILVPLLAISSSYLAIDFHNRINKRRIKKAMRCYVKLKEE